MSHDNPIHLLTHEHHYILKVVHGLSAIDEALVRGQPPDLARLRGVVAFMREFADQCHHAKEEAILFPAMEAKGVPHDGCPLEGLLREHRGKPWMACTPIRRSKRLIGGGHRGHGPRCAELKKGRSALFQHSDRRRERVGALAAAIEAVDQGDPAGTAALREAIAGTQQLYPNHIWKEDQMVFPMAERLFSAEELAALHARFEQAEVELGQDHDRYVAFADGMAALLGQAPAPA